MGLLWLNGEANPCTLHVPPASPHPPIPRAPADCLSDSPGPPQGRVLKSLAPNKDEMLATSHLVVYAIGLAVCSHAENNRDFGLTVFLNGVCVIYECYKMKG